MILTIILLGAKTVGKRPKDRRPRVIYRHKYGLRKNGAGGKGTWGVPGCELIPVEVDVNDPGYNSEDVWLVYSHFIELGQQHRLLQGSKRRGSGGETRNHSQGVQRTCRLDYWGILQLPGHRRAHWVCSALFHVSHAVPGVCTSWTALIITMKLSCALWCVQSTLVHESASSSVRWSIVS